MSKIKKALIFIIAILIIAEFSCRIKFFWLHHGKDWNYITAPFLVQPWNKYYKDKYDTNGFRGDKVNLKKILSEFRIFVVGDSSVDSLQPDKAVWTSQIKSYLPAIYDNKKIQVVNAGRPGFASKDIKYLYKNKIKLFAPDLILYYAAANENFEFTTFSIADTAIGKIKNKIHNVLIYNSMLYTYLQEKINFLLAKRKKEVWVIDLQNLRSNFLDLNAECTNSDSKLIFITQAMNFPRYHKGVDTFNYKNVITLLNSLKIDINYKYENEEIIKLNQRIAVFYLIELCEKYNIPYIDILNPVEDFSHAKRHEMFVDFIHQTAKGDIILGELIGGKLNNLLFRKEGKEANATR